MSRAPSERPPGISPCWGLAVLAMTLWHGAYTFRTVGPEALLALCYLSNLILAAGLLCRSRLLFGIGIGWVLIGWPLWAVDACVSRQTTLSSLALHVTGLGVGLYALRHTLIPRGVVLAALPTGLLSCLLARLYTPPSLNINAVFCVQRGWEWAFASALTSFLFQVMVYTLFFWYLPIMNRWFAGKPDRS